VSARASAEQERLGEREKAEETRVPDSRRMGEWERDGHQTVDSGACAQLMSGTRSLKMKFLAMGGVSRMLGCGARPGLRPCTCAGRALTRFSLPPSSPWVPSCHQMPSKSSAAAEKREREREKAARKAAKGGPREENDEVEEKVEEDEGEEEEEEEFDGPDPRIAQVCYAPGSAYRAGYVCGVYVYVYVYVYMYVDVDVCVL